MSKQNQSDNLPAAAAGEEWNECEVAALSRAAHGGGSMIAAFGQAMQVARVLAHSTLVPKQYIGQEANCLIALNMAERMGADPLMVMQNLAVINGAPAWSAKFLIATVNASGRFEPLKFRVDGEGDDFGCVCWTTPKGGGEPLESDRITVAMAKKEGWYGRNGSKWQTMPGTMLRYRAASNWSRLYAPEISLGFYTKEEAEEMAPPREVEAREVGSHRLADGQPPRAAAPKRKARDEGAGKPDAATEIRKLCSVGGWRTKAVAAALKWRGIGKLDELGAGTLALWLDALKRDSEGRAFLAEEARQLAGEDGKAQAMIDDARLHGASGKLEDLPVADLIELGNKLRAVPGAAPDAGGEAPEEAPAEEDAIGRAYSQHVEEQRRRGGPVWTGD